MDELKKEIKRLSNLKKNEKVDKNVIEKQAQINLWRKQINITTRFKNADEKILAEEFFDSYLENYEFESFADIQNVSDLVYEEVLKHRIQKQIDEILAEKSNKYVPDKTISSLHNIEERIWNLKEKAGILTEKKDDELTALGELKKKFHLHVNFNRNEFTTICGYCGQLLLLRRRVKDFDCLKHPALSGRWLYNADIINDVRDNKLSKEQAAKYLRTTVKYIDWVLANENKIISINGISQDKVDDYVNKNPNLKNANEYKEE